MDALVVHFKSDVQHKCRSNMIQGLFNLQKCKVLDGTRGQNKRWVTTQTPK